MEQDYMNYIDSWLFIESVLDERGAGEKIAELFRRLEKEGMVTSSISLFELKYKLLKVAGEEKADLAIQILMGMQRLVIVPAVSAVALAAADLRKKYYTKERQMSFADAIHLATAKEVGCTTLYSGDPDFKDIEEIRTVIV